MILMAANGIDNDEIAARLDTRREVVTDHKHHLRLPQSEIAL